jgi:hypothetical protein
MGTGAVGHCPTCRAEMHLQDLRPHQARDEWHPGGWCHQTRLENAEIKKKNGALGRWEIKWNQFWMVHLNNCHIGVPEGAFRSSNTLPCSMGNVYRM